MTKKRLFLQVVVPKPLRQPFWYHVDPVPERGVKIGARAVVPFKTQVLIGYVVGTADACDVKTRAVLSILDEEPAVSEPLLRLTEWVSQYYFCAWGEVVHSILPLFDVKIEKWAEISPGALPKGDDVSELERRVVNVLLDSGPVRMADLAKEMGLLPKALRREIDSFRSSKAITISERARKTAARETGTSYVASQMKEEPEQPAQPGDLTHGREPAEREERVLTPNQERIVRSIEPSIQSGEFQVHCIHGLTGSGKTEIYIRLVRQVLDLEKGAIVLVPEISLTYQLLRRFYERFGDRIGVLHSGLTPRERREEWERIRSGAAPVVIGARSAVFAPVRRLGLIVVDEEHDGSYKQNETPRYHGRDVAVKRGSLEKAAVMLGSATPSLETYHNCETGKYRYHPLMERIDRRPMPAVEVLDLKDPANDLPDAEPLTEKLREEIRHRLDRKEQVLVFLNRRGTAGYVQCRLCGAVPECRNCSISLTFHKAKNLLLCHYCGYYEPAPDVCPSCSGTRFRMGATGTQKLQERLQTLSDGVRVTRLDRDTSSVRGSHVEILRQVEDRSVDILVGTQMVTKGHDFSGITLVGVVSADDSLNVPDFRASERTFQLLTQVAGRSGRGDVPGVVYLQTFHPGHHGIESARNHDFLQFYKAEILFRKLAEYPPFFRMAAFHVEGTNEKRLKEFIDRVMGLISSLKLEKKGIRVVGPAQAFVYKLKNRFRWRILLKGEKTGPLHEAVNWILLEVETDPGFKRSGIRFLVDADPVHLL